MWRTAMLIAALATASAAPAAQAAPAHEGRPIVIGRSYMLASRILGGERRLNVYLPAEYAAGSRRFAVLYLLDGGEAEDFHHISGLAQVAAFSGAVEPLIVVGIEGKDRRHDLTSPSSDPADLKAAPTAGGAAAYRRFLVEEVKPWVEARYRTGTRSGLIGESLAGLFVVETFLRAPASFDTYIAASPSLWWDKGALSKEAAADLASGAAKGRRLYVARANEGEAIKRDDGRLVDALRVRPAGEVDWTYAPFPTERHDTIYDPAALAAIRTLFSTGVAP